MSGVKCYEWSATTTATTATNCHSQAQNTSVAITTDTVSHYFLDEVPLHLTGLDSTGGKWTYSLDYSPPKLSPKNARFTVDLREIKQMTHFMFSF